MLGGLDRPVMRARDMSWHLCSVFTYVDSWKVGSMRAVALAFRNKATYAHMSGSRADITDEDRGDEQMVKTADPDVFYSKRYTRRPETLQPGSLRLPCGPCTPSSLRPQMYSL